MPEEAQRKIDETVDALSIAEELGKSIARINELFAFKKRIQIITRFIAVAVVIDICITIAFYLFFNALHSAQSKTCRNINDARAAEVQLWKGVLERFGPQHPTVIQRKRNGDFLRFVSSNFKQLDCHHY